MPLTTTCHPPRRIMPLDVINLTPHPIVFEVKKKAGRGDRITIPAHGRVEVSKPKHGFSLGSWDSNAAGLEKASSSEKSALLGTASHTFNLGRPLGFGSLIEMLTVSDACPWRVYKCKVCGHATRVTITRLTLARSRTEGQYT